MVRRVSVFGRKASVDEERAGAVYAPLSAVDEERVSGTAQTAAIDGIKQRRCINVACILIALVAAGCFLASNALRERLSIE